MKKPENTTIEPEVITELRKRVAKANALAAEYNVTDNINHSPAAFMSAVLREYDNVVNLYTSHSYLHRVVNDIATALGYRMGDTFEPEALVKQVEQMSNEAITVVTELKRLRLDPLTYDGENNEAVDEWTDGYNAALEDMRDIIYKYFPT